MLGPCQSFPAPSAPYSQQPLSLRGRGLAARQSQTWRGSAWSIRAAAWRSCRAGTVRQPVPNSTAARSAANEGGAPEQLSPLQQCLRDAGFADVSFWAQRRFAKYATDAYVEGNLRPKLAALAAEGLRLHQGPGSEALQYLLQTDNHNMIPPELSVWKTNLEELQGLMSGFQLPAEGKRRSNKDLAGLSVVGQMIARNPVPLAGYFNSSPGSLTAQRVWLSANLGLTDSEIARLVWQDPGLITYRLDTGVLDLLQYLDSAEMAGRAGWGRELLLRDASLLRPGNLERVRRNVDVMRGAGCSREDIVVLFNKRPDMSKKVLDGDTFRCKFDWILNESPWGLDVFFAAPAYLSADLARMASRLAFMRQHRLKLPDTPPLVAAKSDQEFCRAMGKQLGRAMTAEEWAAWVEGEWLPSEGGRRWGGRLQQKLDRAKSNGAVGKGAWYLCKN
jgi:hypothetical protein